MNVVIIDQEMVGQGKDGFVYQVYEASNVYSFSGTIDITTNMKKFGNTSRRNTIVNLMVMFTGTTKKKCGFSLCVPIISRTAQG